MIQKEFWEHAGVHFIQIRSAILFRFCFVSLLLA